MKVTKENKYYYDFCYSEYYEPDIGITVCDTEWSVFDGYSIEVKDNESLVKCFETCFDDEFEEYMPKLTVGEYKYYLEKYKHANINNIHKNMMIVNQIESRAYELKNPKQILKKIFGDKSGYGQFYQRFVLLKDYGLLLLDNSMFIERIKDSLTSQEVKILFKNDKEYELQKKKERIKYLNQELPKIEQTIKYNQTRLKKIKNELKQLSEEK